MTQQITRFTPDQLDLVKNTVAKGTTNDEFRLFIEVCKYHGLNPFARQIYAVVRNSQKNGRQLTIQTSIDGYRLLAERSGKYAGQIGPEWCGDDGKWVDVWLSEKPPTAARIGVLRKDFAQPTWGIAKYRSYSQSSPLWDKMPDVMLAKCAESLALRKAFPAEMSGIYTKEEMDQADDLPTVDLGGTSVVDAENTATPSMPDEKTPSQQTTTTPHRRATGSIPHASTGTPPSEQDADADSPAIEQQLSAIISLCKRLDKSVPEQNMSKKTAALLINKLNQELRKPQPSKAS
jgi:phage recombination protein Bet